jgi:hypothetical protein
MLGSRSKTGIACSMPNPRPGPRNSFRRLGPRDMGFSYGFREAGPIPLPKILKTPASELRSLQGGEVGRQCAA